jgi:hypothetical protein
MNLRIGPEIADMTKLNPGWSASAVTRTGSPNLCHTQATCSSASGGRTSG